MRMPQPQRWESTGGFGGPKWPRSMRWWSATQWIIAINVVVFVADLLSGRQLTEYGAFSASAAIFHLQLWRWVTCDFLHADPYHLLFNMLALWAFGPAVELRLRRDRYVAFYLISGLGGILGYLLLWRLNILSTTGDTQLIGASACIFGVLVAAAHLSPQSLIRLMFPPVSLTLRTVAWICIGLAVLEIAYHGENAGGQAAHLGGAAVGYVLIRNVEWLRLL